jgi:hypothetical protein
VLHRSHHPVGSLLRGALRMLDVGSRAAGAAWAAATGLLDASR